MESNHTIVMAFMVIAGVGLPIRMGFIACY